MRQRRYTVSDHSKGQSWVGLEPLESRVLFSANPAEFESIRGRAVDPTSILVRIRQEADAAAFRGPDVRADTEVGAAVGLDRHLREVRLGQGVDVQDALAAYRSDPRVEYAEPNWVYTIQATSNDPYYTSGKLWGTYGDATSPANQYGSQAAEAWQAGYTGSSTVYVGVIDEGIQFSHPDLDANVWTNPYDPIDGVDNDGNGYVDDVHGWDFVRNDNSIYDGGKRGSQDKHGTHVTGTITAEGNNATGVAGVAWNIQYISGKFLGPNGGSTLNAIRAVDYMTDLKTRYPDMRIVATNNSWGGGGYSQGLLDAINRAGAANILFVAAAGNSGVDIDTSPSYPASYNAENIISVAAIDSAGNLASFSNYGDTGVDLGAPGVGIYSTLPSNKYGSYSGTSMAAPHVTGAAALYAAAYPQASAAQIKQALLTAAVPTASLAGKTATGGRLNVASALGVDQTPVLAGSLSTSSTGGTSGSGSTTSLFSANRIRPSATGGVWEQLEASAA